MVHLYNYTNRMTIDKNEMSLVFTAKQPARTTDALFYMTMQDNTLLYMPDTSAGS